MIKNWSIFLLALALFTSTMTVGLPAQAAKVCKVTDPTSTPLNVRDQPNGRVINTLKNGREVNIEAITNDSKGRSWAKVGGYYKGEYKIWGWVLREFISCYER
jgi:hypothetical protein